MKFIRLVALRYIFSGKRHNTINLITGVSMGGVAVGVFAIVVILSVINGIEGVVSESFTQLDPHLKISSTSGRTINLDDPKIVNLLADQNIKIQNPCLEHEGMLSYAGKQSPIIIKGVSDEFKELYDINRILQDGDVNFGKRPFPTAVIGIGLSSKLNLGVQYAQPANLYTAKRDSKINLSRPEAAFVKEDVYICGVISAGQVKANENTVFVPINLARKLLNYNENTASYIELNLWQEESINAIKANYEKILGENYKVENRQEQQADFYKILEIEKWVTFLILSFILLIAIFNVIGSLSMIMIEKKDDITLFRNLGANKKTIIRLFTFAGWMITSIGATIGLVIGIVLCLIQEHIGIIKMGSGFIAENYPVSIQATDCTLVVITVLIMGLFTSYYPVRSALK